MTSSFDVQQVRRQFPALRRQENGTPAIYFDGPAGSQVPKRVADAVTQYLTGTNANHGGPFLTSRESDHILEQAHHTLADFLGASDPETVIFGANMTTLTFALSRAFGRTLNNGDEVLVTGLDHDANVTPWVSAAVDAGAVARHVAVHREDCSLDLNDFEEKLSERTRLVAVGLASNVTGTINPVRKIIEMAHAVGAVVFVDAVHYAPHGLIDVEQLGCDFLSCSAYKFFGPHVGILFGKRDLLESLSAYKLRPAPDSLPGKWMTGTQNHEGISGAAEAVEYLADLGRSLTPDAVDRRSALSAAFGAIADYERKLATRLIEGLARFPEVHIYGITDPDRYKQRVPTVSFTHSRFSPNQIAEYLAHRGIFVWAGNHYALPFTAALDLEPEGTLRVGLLHYNTSEEIDRLLQILKELFVP